MVPAHDAQSRPRDAPKLRVVRARTHDPFVEASGVIEHGLRRECEIRLLRELPTLEIAPRDA